MSEVHSYGPCTAICSRGASTTTGPCTATCSCEAKYNNRSLHCHFAAADPTTSGPCTATCSRGARYTTGPCTATCSHGANYLWSLHCHLQPWSQVYILQVLALLMQPWSLI